MAARGEERRPETAAPQPWADNPEGDEELGGEVPQGWGICGGEKEEELPGNRVAKKERSLLAAIAARGREWGLRRRPRAGLYIRRATRSVGERLTGAAFLQDVAGPTGQEAGFHTRNAASGAAIARRVSKNRHWKGMLKDSEEGMWYAREAGSTREPLEGRCRYRRADDISQGRRRKGYRRADDVMGWVISQNRQRKGTIAGPTKARIRFGGIRIAGRRPEEVSVRLVRRRETPRRLKDQMRTDIWGISNAVVGRTVLSDFDIGRRRHTEVRPSYHFRV
ncbi:hypothetical protein BY996DRAFT_6440179 [Phakopsora pachyrhizi]|nr:hypothetical protein BY996DRAFT_6440179 [Phakopsora pachyrhizi]